MLWNGIKPVFADIDPNTLNLDPERIEAAITPQTTAILPVHCYGRPCDVDAIQQIADNYNLRVIYDAAHAFGVRYPSGSLLRYGDLSVLSFHATKVFTTFEGGAIVCPDAKTKQRIDHLKNFGFVDEVTVVAPGINGKMSEWDAALGLLQLKYFDQAIARRKEIDVAYREGLKGVRGIRCLTESDKGSSNYAYFPILIENDYPISRDALYSGSQGHATYPPTPLLLSANLRLSDVPGIALRAQGQSAGSNAASPNRCSASPMYPALTADDLDRIVGVIAKGGAASK